MQISSLARQILQLLFAESSSQRVLTRPHLERKSGLLSSELNAALQELETQGLLDGRRLRLTLPGLAFAVASGVRAQRPARKRVARVATRRITRTPMALFSARELPRAVA